MVKKNWNNPEILGLGLESTKCDDGRVDSVTFSSTTDKSHWRQCPICGWWFISQYFLDVHITKCHNKPVHPLPDGNEDDWIVPAS